MILKHLRSMFTLNVNRLNNSILAIFCCDGNHKKFWKCIKHRLILWCNIIDALVCEGHGKANILNKYFSSVFTQEDDNVPSLLHFILVFVILPSRWMVWGNYCMI